jgi:hypothetical protein
MEKCNLDPLPIRAITFTQTQLSQVLMKQGHDDESLKVIAKAASFHLQEASHGVLVHNSIDEFAEAGNYYLSLKFIFYFFYNRWV